MYVYIYIYIYVDLCVYIYIYIYTYIHTYTYTHICTQIYIYMFVFSRSGGYLAGHLLDLRVKHRAIAKAPSTEALLAQPTALAWQPVDAMPRNESLRIVLCPIRINAGVKTDTAVSVNKSTRHAASSRWQTNYMCNLYSCSYK